MNLISTIFISSWQLLLEASIYIVFGLLISALLKVFLDPTMVVRHLGRGRFTSVFKAALFGIPIPLCSCGVVPAALSLKKQGANNGATTAFMISTPESGVDSIAVTYALIDPIMALARPLAAFFTAVFAGILENLLGYHAPGPSPGSDPKCAPDACCGGGDGSGDRQPPRDGFWRKGMAGIRYAFAEFWGDLAGWFLFGILLAGIITTLIPENIVSDYLGGGLPAMLFMLVIGIPLYICASASTPIAAALILKGVSPGAALVFLLAGPATNVASLTVLFGTLGKRSAVIYLGAIATCAVGFGLVLDHVYAALGISATAMVDGTSELLPRWLETTATIVLLAVSIKPVGAALLRKARRASLSRYRSSDPTARRGAT
jgi:uncharacterized protein